MTTQQFLRSYGWKSESQKKSFLALLQTMGRAPDGDAWLFCIVELLQKDHEQHLWFMEQMAGFQKRYQDDMCGMQAKLDDCVAGMIGQVDGLMKTISATKSQLAESEATVVKDGNERKNTRNNR